MSYFNVGETHSYLRGTLQTASGAFDISGLSTMELKITRADGTSLSKTPSLYIDGVDGKFHSKWADGDLTVKGNYLVQFVGDEDTADEVRSKITSFYVGQSL